MKAIYKKNAICLFSFFIALVLCGCAAGQEKFALDGTPKMADEEYQRIPPPLLLSGYTGTNQKTEEVNGKTGIIDLSNIGNGYVTAATTGDTPAKFRVKNGKDFYDYDLSNAGAFEVFPLAMGNGQYEFTIFHNIKGNQYAVFLTATATVELENEFIPFLRPSQIVKYDENSDCIALSYQLAQHASTDVEVAATIYHWIEESIDYDNEKAKTVVTNTEYRPDLDKILQDKKGICYDYAALAAAMLRANGIPCKLIMGDVVLEDGQEVYHAWNMIWLKEKGWVAIKLPSTPEEWQRIDLTFAAGSYDIVTPGGEERAAYIDFSAH